jgi:hypothetical protein
MELWELEARESIRDLVARYNASGDSGRVEQVLELFAEDAVMETGQDGASLSKYTGLAEIRTIFTGAADRWGGEAKDRGAPGYVRHNVSTLQIDLIDEEHAKGYCYFTVLMAHGVDHWGRYFDRYAKVDGAWKFTHRVVRTDGSIRDRMPIPEK